jgi:hypothetical protein
MDEDFKRFNKCVKILYKDMIIASKSADDKDAYKSLVIAKELFGIMKSFNKKAPQSFFNTHFVPHSDDIIRENKDVYFKLKVPMRNMCGDNFDKFFQTIDASYQRNLWDNLKILLAMNAKIMHS